MWLHITKIILYISCCLISFFILFVIKGNSTFKIKKWYIVLPPLVLWPIAFLMGYCGKSISQTYYALGSGIMSIGFSLLIIPIILSVNIMTKLIVPFMFNKVLDFHQNYNSANLHKNPIRFFIKYKYRIMYIFYYGAMFIASLSMFFGAVWGHDK